jgi:hypothetical protein
MAQKGRKNVDQTLRHDPTYRKHDGLGLAGRRHDAGLPTGYGREPRGQRNAVGCNVRRAWMPLQLPCLEARRRPTGVEKLDQ